MVWGAIIGAGISVAASLFQSSSSNAAAASGKKDAKKTARDQYKRALVEYDIAQQQDATNYAWDLARTEATRYMDNQKAADYKASQMDLYNQAIDNLTLNTSALMDKYKLEEGLRAQQSQDAMATLNDQNRLARKAAIERSTTERKAISIDEKLNTAQALATDTQYDLRRKNLAEQAALNAEKSNAAVKQYLSSVKQRRMQGETLVLETENDVASLLAEQTSEMSVKQLERNIRVVASMMDQGAARATAGQRGGGSTTARRLAMNDAQILGRQYGEIQTLKQRQGSQLGQMNAEMRGERANNLKRLAELMQSDVDQSKSTIAQTKSMNTILKRQQESIFSQRAQSVKEFGFRSESNRNKLQASNFALMQEKRKVNADYQKMNRDMAITKSGFQLAARQGQRELTGLYISTQASIDQASMPYRKSIIFDPLEPIAGLPPEKRIPTFNTPESPINSYANAIMGGVQTALSFSKMTSNGLKFY